MAGDVAQFLQKKFLASLRDTEFELSGAVLISYLRAIKDIVIDIDTRRLTKDYCRRFIYVLLDLTDAFTKCQVFSHEWKKHSHHRTHLVVFNHLSLRKICFVRKMKKRLAAIKRIFEDEFMKKEETIYNLRESSSRPDPEENLESELPVLIHRGRKFEAEGVGFDEKLRKIGNFLLKSSPSSGAGFAAVGIQGMAGAGKTTLVREFLSWWVLQGEFSPIIWLCLSNIIKENKQVEEEIEVSIVKCMLSKLDHDAVVDGDGIIQEEEKTVSSDNNKSGHLLAALLERLNQGLSDKRYLIVLDDVWHMNDFYSDLGHREQLLEVQEGDKKVGDRLSHGLPKGSGGAVIVTSRISEVVEAMVVPAEGSDQHYNSLIIPLEPLDRERCWDIFKYTVFGYLPDFEYQQHLEKVESEIKDLCYGLPLAARTLAEIMSQNSQNLGRTSPPYRKSEELLQLPDSFFGIPMLVFIDILEGRELFGKFCDLLTEEQVFGAQLNRGYTSDNPERVLKDVYGTLEKLKQKGYYGLASEIQRKMRIIVVGRDEFVNWILGVICDLKLPESPSIAPVPPPTLEDQHQCGIAASFGWKDISNISPLRSFLVDVALTKSMRTDSWHCLIRMKPHSSLKYRLPCYLHEVGDVGKADNPTFYGRFWSHFKLAAFNYSSRLDLTSVAIVKVLNHLGEWEMLHIPERINSICCLNLPIFGPREDRWVAKNTMEDGKTPTNLSFIDNGRLEVIGSGLGFWDKSSNWPLLDQVRGICFEFTKGARVLVGISFDDGAKEFEIPTDELVEIEISYHGQVNILAGLNCEAKSIHHSKLPVQIEMEKLHSVQIPEANLEH
ncbi:hypothetical protein PRUPE_3G175800 [Prunus persica]|uniref:AAA+ ATPase domain-containing protein n=1 Tax=Prunus persica TaxID=3760 RepID=A0A251Q1L3_PRUPE|nr:uncharacterized protein LOC18783108 [Prunus persica]ONI17711.1 hypothetical protein PRUPE_3G175800 [Prunus persica]